MGVVIGGHSPADGQSWVCNAPCTYSVWCKSFSVSARQIYIDEVGHRSLTVVSC